MKYIDGREGIHARFLEVVMTAVYILRKLTILGVMQNIYEEIYLFFTIGLSIPTTEINIVCSPIFDQVNGKHTILFSVVCLINKWENNQFLFLRFRSQAW